MTSAFLPLRSFFSPALPLARLARPPPCRPALSTMSARERRRTLDQARVTAHKAVKHTLDLDRSSMLPTYVMLPLHIRRRCSLTPRLARVKVFLPLSALTTLPDFRAAIRQRLVELFPELDRFNLLRPVDDFDIRFPGCDLLSSLESLQSGVAKFQDAGTPLYFEIIPHNVPPEKPPPSKRFLSVSRRAAAALADSQLQLCMVSFYKFVDIREPAALASSLEKFWKVLGVRGRVYVAMEGVNAQLAVPQPIYSDFADAMAGLWLEHEKPVVSPELHGAFLNVDRVIPREAQPFEKLSVRARDKILADGLSAPLDWEASGREVDPEEWHDALKKAGEDVVVLDCRNDYESDVGRFEGAKALNTKTFRETWPKLEEILKGRGKDTKILTYCTGGIRCVKVNAFLEQRMGFTNTGRLSGGVVSYARTLREKNRLDESVFKGVNHVFDGRMGEVITEDLMDRCVNCGKKCNVQTDCVNEKCPRPFDRRLFVQCEDCTRELDGACSRDCRAVVGGTDVGSEIVGEKRRDWERDEEYGEAFSEEEGDLLRRVRERTVQEFGKRSRMLSSSAQGQLLKMLVGISGARRVLEIGTFTGYSALWMAEGMATGGMLTTFEVDENTADIAEEYFEEWRENGGRVDIEVVRGPGQKSLKRLCEEGRKGFDMVFIDADKGGYTEYVRTILNNEVLKVGGVLVADNVLFRGAVSAVWKEEEGNQEEWARRRLSNMQNVARTAGQLHSFNEYMASERRLEQVLLAFRDGLTVARRVS